MKKIAFAVIMFTVAIMLFSACGSSSELKSGTYVSAQSTAYGHAGVVLEDDGSFMLYVEVMSYCPMGKYTLAGNTLTLTADNDNIHIFMVKNGSLIFESGEWLENVVANGAVFTLSAE